MELDIKTLKLFAVKPKKTEEEINDTRTSRLTEDMVAQNWRTLELCRNYWEALSDFRYRRRRARKYLRGDQWHELVLNDEGETVTEEDYIKERGKQPFKQNVISNIVRNILGQFRAASTRPIVIARKRSDAKLSEMLTNALHTAQDANSIMEMDAAELREKLVSGASVGKTTFGYKETSDKEDILFDNTPIPNFFCNTDILDPRGEDIRMVGEIIDAPLDKIISTFAQNEDEEKIIKGWYTGVNPKTLAVVSEGGKPTRMDSIDFYNPTSLDKARMYEVWELISDWRMWEHDYMKGTFKITKRTPEEVQQENEARILMGLSNGMAVEEIPVIDGRRRKEQVWMVKFLTPYGQCLWQGESPYLHQSHPYTVTFHPLMDGEIYGLVEDIIDQQRYINRLISLIDFVMGSAAKGVLLVPEDSIPDDMSLDEFADEWTKYNGVVKIKTKPGVPLPTQISTNATNIGAFELLSLQLKLTQEISGVSGAIQGQGAKSGTPSSLYAQEAMNSATNIKDIMDNFNFYRVNRDKKMLKTIIQFYEKGRMLKISGNRYDEEASTFDPDLVKDLEYDLVIQQGMDVPAYRMMLDNTLKELLLGQQIDIKMFLENSSLPFADKVLESINAREQQMAQAAQQAQGQLQQATGGEAIDPQLQQEIEQQARKQNPEGMKVIDRLFNAN